MKSDTEKINDYFDKKIKLIKEEDLKGWGFPTQEMEDSYRELLIEEIEINRKYLIKNPDYRSDLDEQAELYNKDYPAIK